jgi:hypothetical protein
MEKALTIGFRPPTTKKNEKPGMMMTPESSANGMI